MKNRTAYGIYCSIVLSFALFGTIYWGYSNESIAQARRVYPLVKEVPARFKDNPKLLLEAYQQGEIPLESVVQILILWRVESDGVWLPLKETDTFLDRYYVDRQHHNALQEEKSARYQNRMKKE